MANVSHASLSGSQLHEPKGADSAALGTVYVSNGAGSGSWNSVGTSSFTGMIADFVTPTVPSGWLELDGSVINTTTFSALYGTMTIQTTGTRSNGSAIITSIPDTSSFRAGYYIFGTGFITGTTILSIDSGTQITVSNTASGAGSTALAISPWLLNTGTIKLPDVSTAGRYRRSRTASTAVGQVQADQNQAHTHTGSGTIAGTTDSQGAHTHTVNVSDPGHTHVYLSTLANQSASGAGNTMLGQAASNTNSAVTGITASTVSNGAHTHSVTGTAAITTASSGSTEARPLSLIVMTCVKT